jgi:hypothetical protein
VIINSNVIVIIKPSVLVSFQAKFACEFSSQVSLWCWWNESSRQITYALDRPNQSCIEWSPTRMYQKGSGARRMAAHCEASHHSWCDDHDHSAKSVATKKKSLWVFRPSVLVSFRAKWACEFSSQVSLWVFKPSVLVNFKSSVLVNFEPSVLVNFEPSVLVNFEPSVLVNFKPSVLVNFKPSVLVNFRVCLIRTQSKISINFITN